MQNERRRQIYKLVPQNLKMAGDSQKRKKKVKNYVVATATKKAFEKSVKTV